MEHDPKPFIAATDSPAAPVGPARSTPLADRQKAATPSNVIPLHRGIAPIRPPVDYDTRPRSADTPLVAFFRRHQETIGLVCLAVATVAGCLFAFQVGRGAL